MSDDKKAAIEANELESKAMNDVSAADFLRALEGNGLAARHLAVWPEKKKVELWAEPEAHPKAKVIDVIRVIRVEKKKYELEKIPGMEFEKPAGVEGWRDPRDWREILFDDIARRVADHVEARMNTRR